MAYTVLARKYRSQTFDEVVGQAAVTTTLRNAITSERIHHGYLFCGTRGVGKTSLARILAKSLNCLTFDAPTLTPCGACDSCKSIAQGGDIDVIEIDAASNTGVDNIRELRSNAVYRPARSRYKVYIIDEVHMLSPGAFNALLKTLEEPPGHVKFVFATTDPQKVPATIQSRCQRFDFKPISVDDIADCLANICKAEKIKSEPAALRRVARLANGSLRDGVSLLDQLMSVCESKLTSEAVDEFLPAPHDELMAELIDRLAESDLPAVLDVADRSLQQGQMADQWCSALIGQIRDLMVMRVCGAETELVDAPATARSQLAEQAQKFEPAAYVFMIAVLEELRRAVRYSGSSRALIEAALVRLADTARFASIEALLAKLDAGAAGGDASAPSTSSRPSASATAASPRRPISTPAAASKKKEALSADSGQKAAAAPGAGSSSPATCLPESDRPAVHDDTDFSSGGNSSDADSSTTERATTAPPRRAAAISPPKPAQRDHAFAGSASSASSASSANRREDIRAAMSHPVIRQAMDMFDGSIVRVERVERVERVAAPMPAADDLADDDSEPAVAELIEAGDAAETEAADRGEAGSDAIMGASGLFEG
jgi:DNA polymerase-3 subunit gamma/tau